MKSFIKIFLSLCVFLFVGNGNLYAHTSSNGDGFTFMNSLPKSTVTADNAESNCKFYQHKQSENADKNCLFEIEEEQDDEKFSKKQIPLIVRVLTAYPQNYRSLSCTEKEYLTSSESYSYFSTQRYITFCTFRV